MGDYGAGRWRLCLAVPSVPSVEQSAWCLWSDDRSAVTAVLGAAVGVNALDYNVALSLDKPDVDLGVTDRATAMAAGYAADHGSAFVHAADDRADGSLDFDLGLVGEPGGPLPGVAPARLVGSMRWACGDAPPAR